ncbi:hypothetical protein CLV51_10627 [Chitinophaga niastensis]|uniref:Uncharacterized protein n=1 Tax=Chitinophaga niastensis TaxID=536980 RepID=A0A2P8HDA6_CHINA|nr:hypothetical protein CLV51_10627 [Chitinophaga niastensis]
MNEKERLLNVIKSNVWVTGGRRSDLIPDLQQYYQIDRNLGEALIQECLAEGLISINNEGYSISRFGTNP